MFKVRRILLLVLAATLLCGMGFPQESQHTPPQTPSRFHQLVDRWSAVPSGSPEEAVLEDSIRALVRRILPPEVIEKGVRYWQAAPNSPEEQEALDSVNAALQELEDVDYATAAEMVNFYLMSTHPTPGWLTPGDPGSGGEAAAAFARDIAREIGDPEPLPELDVEFLLLPPREGLEAGERFNLSGIVRNRSDSVVWLTAGTSRLQVPAAVWGTAQTVGSIGGTFPTITSQRQKESPRILRLEPGKEYPVSWQIDPFLERWIVREGKISGFQSALARHWYSVVDFWPFKPTDYRLAAVLHVWPRQPTFENRIVPDRGASFTVSADQLVSMKAPTVVLALGAVIGGVMSFLLVLFAKVRKRSFSQIGGWRSATAGLAMAVILTSVVTILMARLAETDFLIRLEVQDFWGALATGFVVQWIGISYLVKVFGEPEGLRDGPDEGKPALPGPEPGGEPGGEPEPGPEPAGAG